MYLPRRRPDKNSRRKSNNDQSQNTSSSLARCCAAGALTSRPGRTPPAPPAPPVRAGRRLAPVAPDAPPPPPPQCRSIGYPCRRRLRRAGRCSHAAPAALRIRFRRLRRSVNIDRDQIEEQVQLCPRQWPTRPRANASRLHGPTSTSICRKCRLAREMAEEVRVQSPRLRGHAIGQVDDHALCLRSAGRRHSPTPRPRASPAE